MKIAVILVSLLAAVSLAAAYTPEEQATIEGVRLSFELGQAYEKALHGENINGFNSLVDQWNAWVFKNFGNDTSLLMAKMMVPINEAPNIVANTSPAKGIVHEMDSTARYATNDISSLPDAVRKLYEQTEEGKEKSKDFLGGV